MLFNDHVDVVGDAEAVTSKCTVGFYCCPSEKGAGRCTTLARPSGNFCCKELLAGDVVVHSTFCCLGVVEVDPRVAFVVFYVPTSHVVEGWLSKELVECVSSVEDDDDVTVVKSLLYDGVYCCRPTFPAVRGAGSDEIVVIDVAQ